MGQEYYDWKAYQKIKIKNPPIKAPAPAPVSSSPISLDSTEVVIDPLVEAFIN